MTLVEKALWDLEDVVKYIDNFQGVEKEAVRIARKAGATWADIARVYGVSRQAAHARWSKKEEEWN